LTSIAIASRTSDAAATTKPADAVLVTA